MIKAVLLVTIYNKEVLQSSTINSFLTNCRRFHDIIELFVWDNSTSITVNNSLISFSNIKYSYYKSENNTPLSIVYNSAIKKYKDYDVLFNFDHDSVLTETYFDMFFEAYNNNDDIGLFCPQIFHGDQCVSPGCLGKFRFNYYDKGDIPVGRTSSKNVTSITSGVALILPLLKRENLWYDENLSLYGVDLMFSLDYSRFFKDIYIMEYKLEHDLSQFDNSENKKIKVFKLRNSYYAERYILKKESKICALLYSDIRFIYNLVATKLFYKML